MPNPGIEILTSPQLVGIGHSPVCCCTVPPRALVISPFLLTPSQRPLSPLPSHPALSCLFFSGMGKGGAWGGGGDGGDSQWGYTKA